MDIVQSASFPGVSKADTQPATSYVREREILRVSASLGGCNGKQTAKNARQEILKWVKKRTGSELPDEAWDHGPFEHMTGGRDCSAVRIVDETIDVWAVRANDPDKHVAQRIWTTEIVVGFRTGEKALLSVRLLASSPEPVLNVMPAVPRVLCQIANKYGLYHGADRLIPKSQCVESHGAAEELIDTLLDPARRIPIIVLTTLKNEEHLQIPPLDPEPIARAMLGLANVIVVPARFTWTLTERFGKRLSVFGGGARIYLPGLADDSNPYNHPLFPLNRSSSRIRASQIPIQLRRAAATESLRLFRLGRDVLTFSEVRIRSLELASERLEHEGAIIKDRLCAERAQITALKKNINELEEFQQLALSELDDAKEKVKITEDKLNFSNLRIRQLTDQLIARGDRPDSDIPSPASWEKFADWCEQHLEGRVLLSRHARGGVKTPKFKDFSTAAKCLLWLANDYRQARLSGGGDNLRREIMSGIRNDRCGADSFDFDWQNRKIRVNWHIKSGGNTRDPTRCLRIYYFWDEINQQVVIVDMPAHRRTGAT